MYVYKMNEHEGIKLLGNHVRFHNIDINNVFIKINDINNNKDIASATNSRKHDPF